MSLHYSASTGGFYDSDIHGKNIPSDAVEITSELYQSLITGQSSGKMIVSDGKGKPSLKDRPAPTVDELAVSARQNRDALIAATDYLVMPDYPIAADLLAKVKAYRQALRDITSQKGFPTEIAWPVNPMDEVAA